MEDGFKTFIAVVCLGIVLTIIVLVVASAVSIPAGHVGVETLFGDVNPKPLEAGFHWTNPFSQVHDVSIRRDVTSGTGEASSSDLQAIEVTVAAEYRIDSGSATTLYRDVGGERDVWNRVIVDPAIQETVKAVCARYTAENLITQREMVKGEIRQQLTDRLAKTSLILVELNITNFGFSATFNDAIEAKVKAEQETLKAKNELDRVKVDAEQQVTKADADRRSRQLAADAKAYETTTIADASAKANEVLAASLSDPILRQRWLDKWDGVLPRVLGTDAGVLIPIEGK